MDKKETVTVENFERCQRIKRAVIKFVKACFLVVFFGEFCFVRLIVVNVLVSLKSNQVRILTNNLVKNGV